MAKSACSTQAVKWLLFDQWSMGGNFNPKSWEYLVLFLLSNVSRKEQEKKQK
jgi:hypothetical protein